MSCATVQYMCRVLLRAMRCGGKPFSRRPGVIRNDLKVEVERSFALIPIIPQIWQRTRIAFRTRMLAPSGTVRALPA